MVAQEIAVEVQPWRPIFEKCSHLREKGEVLMLFKTTPHLGAKAQYMQYHGTCRSTASCVCTTSTAIACSSIYGPRLETLRQIF